MAILKVIIWSPFELGVWSLYMPMFGSTRVVPSLVPGFTLISEVPQSVGTDRRAPSIACVIVMYFVAKMSLSCRVKKG